MHHFVVGVTLVEPLQGLLLRGQAHAVAQDVVDAIGIATEGKAAERASRDHQVGRVGTARPAVPVIAARSVGQAQVVEACLIISKSRSSVRTFTNLDIVTSCVSDRT